MGRSEDDISYFTGRKKSRGDISRASYEKKSGGLDTSLYTSISEGQRKRLMRGDGVADVLAKLYNFMKFVHDSDMAQRKKLSKDSKKHFYSKVNSFNRERAEKREKEDKKNELFDSPFAQSLANIVDSLVKLGLLVAAVESIIGLFKNFKLPQWLKDLSESKYTGSKQRGYDPNKDRKLSEKITNKENAIKEELKNQPKSKNRSTRLFEDLTDAEKSKLKSSNIEFDKKSGEFKQVRKTGSKKPQSQRISADMVSEKLGGKAIPAPEVPKMFEKFGIADKMAEARKQLNLSRGTTTGQIVSGTTNFVTKKIGQVAMIYGIYVAASECVDIYLDYKNIEDPTENDKKEMEQAIFQVIVATMLEFGVSYVVAWLASGIVSILTASLLGPFAILAGAAAGITAAVLTVKYGGEDINQEARKLAKQIVSLVLNWDEIQNKKKNADINSLEDLNNFNKQMSELTGTSFTPIGEDSAVAGFFDQQNVLKGRNDSHSQKRNAEILKMISDNPYRDISNLTQQQKEYQLKKQQEAKTVIIDNSKNNQVGNPMGDSPAVIIEDTVNVRTEDSTLLKVQKNNYRPH